MAAWLLFAGALAVSAGQDTQTEPSAEAPAFFLPKNPKAAEYMLNRLSNEQLLKVPRSEPVHAAILRRAGLEARHRLEAAQAIAKTRGTDPAAILLETIAQLDTRDDALEPVILELGQLALQRPKSELGSSKPALENLRAATKAASRQMAWASLALLAGDAVALWDELAATPDRLSDLILGLGWVPDPGVQARVLARVQSAALSHADLQLRAAALTALPRFVGQENAAFETLASAVSEGTAGMVALGNLTRISRKAWPRERASQLIDPAIALLRKTPEAERTEPAFAQAMQAAQDLASLLPPDARKAAEKTLRGLGVRLIVLRTLREQMLYDKNRIVVEAGKPAEILLENDDVMQHNLVVVTPGAIEEIGQAAERMAPEPDAQGRLHVPDSPKVLHATRMLNPGESERLRFTAPAEPGDYGYVCTYPGHWRRMVGTLVVVADLEDYLATHGDTPEPVFTEWKLADLVPSLADPKLGNPTSGRQHFTNLACGQCHRLGAEGYAFGPDLTELAQRYQRDRTAILREILDPSNKIDDRYRNTTFDLADGESVSGIVLEETAEHVRIQSGPADVLIQNLKPGDIRKRSPQPTSLMPAGLLNSLTKEQILDLVAFLETGGKVAEAGHAH